MAIDKMKIVNQLYQEGFVVFSFHSITTQIDKNGVERKKMIGMSAWSQLDYNNCQNSWNREHKGWAIVTGAKSNLSVIDVDDYSVYETMIQQYPILKTYRTIRTNKGVHIYCQYNDQLKNTTDVCRQFHSVDIRNDGGIITCPPTSYMLKNGNLVVYTDLGGSIEPIPQFIMDDLKPTSLVGYQTETKLTKLQMKLKHVRPIESDMTIPYFNYIRNALGRGLYQRPLLEGSYDDWRDLGFIIHNINNTEIGFELFKQISQTNQQKYNADYTLEFWNSIGNDCPNPMLIKKLFYRDPLMVEIFNSQGASFTIANLIKHLYPNEITSVNIKGNSCDWYVFKNGRWLKTDNDSLMSGIIINEITPLFNPLPKPKKTDKNDDDIDEKNTYDEMVIQIKTNLLNIVYRRHVMVECALLYNNDNFIKLLDNNPNLLGFTNGVYDFKIHALRPSLPTDYISLSCGYDYREYDRNDPIIEEILDFIGKIFPPEELGNATLKLIASCLCSGNNDQLFNIWTGCGSNGKSKLIQLISMALGGIDEGSYYKNIPVSYFTQKQREATGAPMPDITRLKGVKIVTATEPEEDAVFNIGKIKDWTGQEDVSAREMYAKRLTNFKSNFCTIFSCNTIPKMPSNITTKDKAVWRRAFITPFMSEFKFENEIDPTKPYQFVKDIMIHNKFEAWKSAFMYILINFVPSYQTEGLTRTTFNDTAITEYKNSGSVFHTFIENNIETTRNENDFISLTDLWNAFKTDKLYQKSILKRSLKEYFENYTTLVSEKHVTIDGSARHISNVFVGIKWCESN